jgi:hypothetical protein
MIDIKDLKTGDRILWESRDVYNNHIIHTGTIEHIATHNWICVREQRTFPLAIWYRLIHQETEWINIANLTGCERVIE